MSKRHYTNRCSWLSIGIGVVAVACSPALAGENNMSNGSITDAIEDELLLDDAVFLNNIDVSTIDGIVTLSGKVDNLLEKQRAARIAETVKGVKSVVNQITVRSTGRSDSEIRQDVNDALLKDPATDSYEISAAVEDGIVTLTGTVESWAERDLSEKVAKGVRGVLGIDNRISVSYETDRPDHEIKAEVENKLEWDTLVDDYLIDVKVTDGKVSLSGTIGSAAEKRQARMDAWVAGVKSVNDKGLKIRDWAEDEELRKSKFVHKPDDEIREAINDALLWDPRVNSFNVTPHVSNAHVTLRGEVDNLKAKRAAAQDARNTTGVSYVANRIKVRTDDQIGDETIEQNVRDALKRDAFVEKFDITVDAINGVVDLYGEVDSYFEKSRADEVASRVNGVLSVDNNLVVDDDLYVYDPYLDEPYVYDYDWYDYEPDYTLRRSDANIKEEIEDELWWSPFVDSDDIDISVTNGVATLTGTADSYSERRIAAENALEGGAVQVHNEIEVN